MDGNKFENLVKNVICDYVNKNNESLINTEDVSIVWMCKILQNNKAIAITNLPDNILYELSYNGNNNDLYVDEYTKVNNTCYHFGD